MQIIIRMGKSHGMVFVGSGVEEASRERLGAEL